MKRPEVSPSRASDLLVAAVILLAVVALLPIGDLTTVALGILVATLIVWPVGVLIWLARRWARVSDLRFVLLAVLLVAAATTSALTAIALSR
jgi:hypothetical protein